MWRGRAQVWLRGQDFILPFMLFVLKHFNRDPDNRFSPLIKVSGIFNFLCSASETTAEVKSLEKQVTKRANRRRAEQQQLWQRQMPIRTSWCGCSHMTFTQNLFSFSTWISYVYMLVHVKAWQRIKRCWGYGGRWWSCAPAYQSRLQVTSRLLFLTDWKTDTAAQPLLIGSGKPLSDSALFL